jgi:fatty acid desaturase
VPVRVSRVRFGVVVAGAVALCAGVILLARGAAWAPVPLIVGFAVLVFTWPRLEESNEPEGERSRDP